jgi:hypothetical protein
MEEAIIAQLTLKDSRHWTNEEAMKVASWLREKANQLLVERSNYAKTFKARYYRCSLGA